MSRSFLRRLAGTLFIVAALFFLVRAVVGRREELLAYDWSFEGGWLALSIALLLCGLMGSAVIWRRVLAAFDHDVALVPLARVWFVSSLGRYIPGKVWQLVGVADMARALGIDAVTSITSLALYMLYATLSASVLGVYLFPLDAIPALEAPLVVARWVAPMALLLLHPALVRAALRIPGRLLKRELRPWRGTTVDAAVLLVMCTGQWLVYGAAFHAFTASLTDAPIALFPHLVASFALSFVAGYVVVIAPAGLGAKEGALALLLSGVMPLGVAAAVAIGARLWTMTGEVIPALLLLRRRA
ncbi:MAG: hypothetical protein PVJ80_02400 [Gemmatimonadota bacterium]